jgi:hypothetical protein
MLCRHECRSIKSTTMSGYVDELYPKYSGGFRSDVTTVFACSATFSSPAYTYPSADTDRLLLRQAPKGRN